MSKNKHAIFNTAKSRSQHIAEGLLPRLGGGVMLKGWFRLNMVAALALAVHAIAPTASLAEQWPTHPVRWVLPFGPGSGADTAARLITDRLQQKWGQPVIIDGRPGGDGLLSLGIVVSA